MNKIKDIGELVKDWIWFIVTFPLMLILALVIGWAFKDERNRYDD